MIEMFRLCVVLSFFFCCGGIFTLTRDIFGYDVHCPKVLITRKREHHCQQFRTLHILDADSSLIQVWLRAHNDGHPRLPTPLETRRGRFTI